MSLPSKIPMNLAVSLGVITIAITVSLSIILLSSLFAFQDSKQNVLEHWNQRIDHLVMVLTNPLMRGDMSTLDSLAKTLVSQEQLAAIKVTDRLGRLRTEVKTSLFNQANVTLRREIKELWVIEISVPTNLYQSFSHKPIVFLVLCLTVLATLLAIATYLYINKLMRPVLDMQKAVEAFELGHWKQLKPKGSAELQALSAGLNQMARRITLQATEDPVTGHLNRKAIENHIHSVLTDIQRTNRVAIIGFIDLDHFKKINDHFGHAFGDAVLAEISHRIKQHLPAYFKSGRFGGDEFLVIGCLKNNINNAEKQLASSLSTLVNKLAEPAIINNQKIYPSASIGTALVPRDGQDTKKILVRADMALYAAKRAGRSKCIAFQPQHEYKAQQALQNSGVIRNALSQNLIKHELQLIYHANSRELWGGETLMRVHSPDGSYMPPPIVIETAEQIGVIPQITSATVVNAMNIYHDMIDLRKELKPLVITINLSKKQLLETNFFDEITKLSKQFNIPLPSIMIELTEEDFLFKEDVKEKLLACKKAGFSIALDDFGSGYASLACLQAMPLTHIKLDKSFISEIPENRKACQLFQSTVDLLRNLDFIIIAEGIESLAQIQFATNAGCHLLQGYYLAKPDLVENIIPQFKKPSYSYTR